MLTILDYFCNDGLPLLDKGMPSCPQAYLNAMLADKNLTVQPFTLTLAPKWHGEDIKKLKTMIKNFIRNVYGKTKAPYFLELHFELTKNNILHCHLYQIGTKYVCSKLTSAWRKTFGFTYPSKLTNLIEWIKYISKEDVFPPFKYYVICRKYIKDNNIEI